MRTFNLIVRKYRHGEAKYSFLPKATKLVCVLLELQFAIANTMWAKGKACSMDPNKS